jgi:hypothetical protein
MALGPWTWALREEEKCLRCDSFIFCSRICTIFLCVYLVYIKKGNKIKHLCTIYTIYFIILMYIYKCINIYISNIIYEL